MQNYLRRVGLVPETGLTAVVFVVLLLFSGFSGLATFAVGGFGGATVPAAALALGGLPAGFAVAAFILLLTALAIGFAPAAAVLVLVPAGFAVVTLALPDAVFLGTVAPGTVLATCARACWRAR
jgi:hypothetical protein